jgi:hypothetical protein
MAATAPPKECPVRNTHPVLDSPDFATASITFFEIRAASFAKPEWKVRAPTALATVTRAQVGIAR